MKESKKYLKPHCNGGVFLYICVMDELMLISKESEVWKRLNIIYPSIDDSWVISNYGRAFRLPYFNGHFSQKLTEISLSVIPYKGSNYTYFSVGIGKNRMKVVTPFVVSKLFNDNFSEISDSMPRYIFLDGDSKNNHIDNIVVYYPLVNYPKLVWDFYKRLSLNVKTKKFKFLTSSEFNDLDYDVISKTYNEWSEYNNCTYYTCFPTGSSILKLITDTLKKLKLQGGIESWLIYNGENCIDTSSGERIKYISNCGSSHISRVECFVRNVYYKLGLIDGDFKQTSLSKIVDENFEQYDPVPDEYFKHPISGELVISETFGFSQKHGDNDKLSKLYVEKSKVKYQLYSKYIFIDLWVKTLTLKEILNLINDKLIIGGIINNPLLFSEDLMPQSEKIHIESELKEIKKRIGIFDLTKLKEIDQYLHNKLADYCKDLGTTSIQFLNDRIYPEIELPIGEGGFLSIKGFIRNNNYTKRVMDLISEGKVKNTKDLFREDSALYYCIYRMTHSNKKTITQWMDETFPNLNRKKKSNELTYEEVLNTVSGFKNRNEVQLKHPGIYKYAKQLGIIDEIYPKQMIKNV